jgi:hypothetical protein
MSRIASQRAIIHSSFLILHWFTPPPPTENQLVTAVSLRKALRRKGYRIPLIQRYSHLGGCFSRLGGNKQFNNSTIQQLNTL